MKIKLDENMPEDAAEILTAAGHDAGTALRQGLGGRPDSDVAAACRAEGRALITLDTDFADVRTYPPQYFAGIIVLRLADQGKANVLAVTTRLLDPLRSEPLAGRH